MLTGPQAITYAEVAAALSSATGGAVEFIDVPDEGAKQGLLAAGMPEFVAEQLLAVFAQLRCGVTAEVTDTVRVLTGARQSRLSGER